MIRVRKLTFTYPGNDKPTLQELDFEIDDGEVFGIRLALSGWHPADILGNESIHGRLDSRCKLLVIRRQRTCGSSRLHYGVVEAFRGKSTLNG